MAFDHNTRVKLKMYDKAVEQAAKVASRAEDNKKILQALSDFIEVHPDLRFGQVLAILGLDKDRFNQEPADTLKDIEEVISKLGK